MLETGAKRVKIMGDEIDVAATIRKLDDYSGHADGPELVQWVRERLPIARNIFLTHGEDEPQQAFAEKLRALMPDDHIIRPRLDDVFDLSSTRATHIDAESKPRIDPTAVAKLDWNNDLQSLVLDVQDKIKSVADAKGKAALVRKLRRALEEAG
jgi:metallo-beta-lactamase family protein